MSLLLSEGDRTESAWSVPIIPHFPRFVTINAKKNEKTSSRHKVHEGKIRLQKNLLGVLQKSAEYSIIEKKEFTPAEEAP
jgi:hypothetical protein